MARAPDQPRRSVATHEARWWCIRDISGPPNYPTSGDATAPFINDGPTKPVFFRNSWIDLSGLAVNRDGKLYVADTGEVQTALNQYRRLVHTFAGTGLYRRESENRPAVVSYLNFPTRLAPPRAAQIDVAPNGDTSIAGSGSCWTVTGPGGFEDGPRATSFGIGGIRHGCRREGQSVHRKRTTDNPVKFRWTAGRCW